MRAQKRVNYSAAATVRRESHVEILLPVEQANRESFRRDTNVASLDPDVMGRILGVGYQDLAQSRFTPESDSYLNDVLRRVRG